MYSSNLSDKRFLYGTVHLDYEFSYGEQVAIIPRNYPIKFHYAGTLEHHYAMHWHGTCSKWIIHCIMMQQMKKDLVWQASILSVMLHMQKNTE